MNVTESPDQKRAFELIEGVSNGESTAMLSAYKFTLESGEIPVEGEWVQSFGEEIAAYAEELWREKYKPSVIIFPVKLPELE